ncbi:hypothetical protein OBK22_11910 [Empedobacter falsenii]
MNQLSEISNSFEETLKDNELQDVTFDLAETFTDAILSDGILKDIPIIGTIVGLTKASINFKDRLFIKKLIYFMSEISEIDKVKRNRMIQKIDESKEEKIKIGEKLIYIIDKCEDHISTQYISKLFKSFLNEEITYDEFLRGAIIIQKIYIKDFEKFLKSEYREIEISIGKHESGITDFHSSLINVGICASSTEPMEVRDQDDYEMRNKYVVEGGNEIVYLTNIGDTLKKKLKPI